MMAVVAAEGTPEPDDVVVDVAEVEVVVVAVEQTLVPALAAATNLAFVFGPDTPSTVSFSADWNARIPCEVAGPLIPSTVPE